MSGNFNDNKLSNNEESKEAMTLSQTQAEFVEISLMKHADEGKCLNKSEIITAVVEELGVPRPTVRRVKSELLKKLLHKVDVLR